MLVLVAGSGALSWLTGTPTRLPGAALGSELMLHLEKGALILAFLLLLFVLLVQAYHGRLPLEMRGYRFGPLREIKEENDAAIDEIWAAVRLLDARGAAQERQLQTLEESRDSLRRALDERDRISS